MPFSHVHAVNRSHLLGRNHPRRRPPPRLPAPVPHRLRLAIDDERHEMRRKAIDKSVGAALGRRSPRPEPMASYGYSPPTSGIDPWSSSPWTSVVVVTSSTGATWRYQF